MMQGPRRETSGASGRPTTAGGWGRSPSRTPRPRRRSGGSRPPSPTREPGRRGPGGPWGEGCRKPGREPCVDVLCCIKGIVKWLACLDTGPASERKPSPVAYNPCPRPRLTRPAAGRQCPSGWWAFPPLRLLTCTPIGSRVDVRPPEPDAGDVRGPRLVGVRDGCDGRFQGTGGGGAKRFPVGRVSEIMAYFSLVT